MWTTIHKIKHLSRVQQLLETPQELHPLVIAALRIHEHEERARASGARRLPESVGVHGIEGDGRDEGNFALSQRALGGELGFTVCVNLQVMKVR